MKNVPSSNLVDISCLIIIKKDKPLKTVKVQGESDPSMTKLLADNYKPVKNPKSQLSLYIEY